MHKNKPGIRIALASKEFVNNDTEGNSSVIAASMLEAKSKNADLICFGETFLQGFDSLSWRYDKDKHIALARTSKVISDLRRHSKNIGIDLGLGYIEKAGGKIYSSYILIEKGKIINNYRRISKGWKEFSVTGGHYAEGRKPRPFSYKKYKCMTALCVDLWDCPEIFQAPKDLLFWPVYVDFSIEEWENNTLSNIANWRAKRAKMCF